MWLSVLLKLGEGGDLATYLDTDPLKFVTNFQLMSKRILSSKAKTLVTNITVCKDQ